MESKHNMESNQIDWLYLGAGESGVGAAYLAQQQGYDVFVSDFGAIADNYKKQLQDWNIRFEENQHTEGEILGAVEVIKSPGIPDKAPIVKKIKEKSIPVISEIEFAGQIYQCQNHRHHRFKRQNHHHQPNLSYPEKCRIECGLAGNIGKSFAYQVATEKFDCYVLELSSFMLDDMYEFKVDIGVLLNITPDHLDRYDYKMENYVASKFRITQNQTARRLFYLLCRRSGNNKRNGRPERLMRSNCHFQH